MPPSVGIQEALKSNCTFVAQLLKMTAKDSTVAAWISHTRYLTVGGQLYAPASPIDISRIVAREGLEADGGEVVGIIDDVVTKPDLLAERWSGARIYTAWVVDYRAVTPEVVREQKGFVGKVKVKGTQFTAELLSLSHALHQTIGQETQPTDRRRSLAETGITMTSHTHARTVASFTDRQVFVVSGTAQADSYFRYGKATWTSGANNGLSMEIKDNTGNSITLVKPMRSAIANSDGVTLIRGYDGTRTQAKLIDTALMLGFDGEPDLKGMTAVLNYPE